MKLSGFSSPYIKVDCSDGPRFILRKPETAFSIIVPEGDKRISAILNALKIVEASIEVEMANKIHSIVENLDKNYAEVQAHYQAAYLSFCSSPCSKGANDALAKANAEIRSREFKLREIEIQTEKFLAVINRGKEDKTEIKIRGIRTGLDDVSAIATLIEELTSQFGCSFG
jgi:hypothetical protein